MIAIKPRQERGRRFVWQLTRRALPDDPDALGAHQPLLAQLLRNRGLADAEAARRFLAAEYEPLAPPEQMAGLPQALERLSAALRAGELIAIYGDYDVDGLTATALLCCTLARLGGRVLPFIPHRERDGYGLQDGPLAQLRAAGASLVVTVDCGVSAVAEVARARALGLDVIVTDHHLVPAELPATAVLNPRRADCAYPYKELSGAGVAFRLAEGLLRASLPAADALAAVEDIVDLAAIGTLADVVPLRGENRALVRRGLGRLRSAPRPGLLALMRRAAVDPTWLSAEQVCYALVPRLNAAGRLDDAALSLRLLLSESVEEAAGLAEQLETLNRLRQRYTAEALGRIRADLRTREIGAAIVVADDIPLGLAGLLASRLADEFGRPAIVLRRDGERYAGSARSAGGLNLVELLAQHGQLLGRFGGHAMAAGLSLSTEHLAAFEQAFTAAVAAAVPVRETERPLTVDAELGPATVARWETLDLLQALEPFGVENPEPIFITRDLRVLSSKALPRGGCCLRLAVPGVVVEAVTFEPSELPDPGSLVDLVYHLKRDTWRGQVKPRLLLRDWRHSPAGPTPT